MHFGKTKRFSASKQKSNFYLTVVEEPSNAVRCENESPIVETFPSELLYMPLKTNAFPRSCHH
jgi:hypothetical protein